MKRSKIKVTGIEAYFYDSLINIATGFSYGRLIKSAVEKMNIKGGDKLIDLGGGTGRNTKLFAKAVGKDGNIVLADIGKTMLKKAKKRLKKYDYCQVIEADILKPFKISGFNIIFISFVMHGLEIRERSLVMKNVSKLLKKGGRLYILDYNEFDVNKLNPIAKYLFTHLECELATEFSSFDLVHFLRGYGFGKFEKWRWKDDKIRLLKAVKL